MEGIKMRKKFLTHCLAVVCSIPFLLTTQTARADQTNHITQLKEMFNKVTIDKNDKAIPMYYHKDFELYSNGNMMKYDVFLQMHKDIYKTAIQYKIRYDDKTFVEQDSKIAGRLFITTKKPNEKAQEIEVLLIAEYKDNKLYRVWELTYPDWSKMKPFQKHAK
jgi:hypothetical protein